MLPVPKGRAEGTCVLLRLSLDEEGVPNPQWQRPSVAETRGVGSSSDQ